MSGPVGVGIIGAGVISGQYLEHLMTYPDVRVLFVADLDTGRAARQAAAFGVPGWGTVEELLAQPDVEIVVNLTIPAAHIDVSLAILDAGKHVWSEKPIGLDLAGAGVLVSRADELGLRFGVAPDTTLGSGVQTALRAIRRGDIGRPLSALTLMQSPGPDLWHPSPDFLFQAGGGPVLDMGPYYLSALVHTFGSVARVQAVGHRAHESRSIRTGPRAGERFAVTEPTSVAMLLDFAGGTFGVSHFSFDSPLSRNGFLEVTGTEATIAFPDPNQFGGSPVLTTAGGEKRELPVDAGGQGRGLGVVDLARVIRGAGQLQASGALGLHVLDVMISSLRSLATREAVAPSTEAPAIPPLDESWDARVATL
ncbi:MAG TPA: Gfo/Idh/MocA family oxidoreductase [Microbacterium sp.]|uniref:Gfo/Idh/MocA family protein n=1 Tax=Microbacterium sp. TaxID=51671 RepID=UPI002D08E3BA|nr:Gfo/Idh/MocA family oxidoreductase [Microbacterium sp.]HWI31864.1 Gfo/Idh/MocA family oxidoreductase [Microbacterium sp.]